MEDSKWVRRAWMTAATVAASISLAAAPALKIVNTYADKEVWITTTYDGAQIQSFCVGKGATKVEQHSSYAGSFRVRAEVMTGPACKGAKICDTDMGMPGRRGVGSDPNDGVYVHQNATIKDRCYLSFTSVKADHKLTVSNTYKDRYVWFTTYNDGLGRSQIHSGCVNPGQNTVIRNDRYEKSFAVRAEVMTAAACKGDKICDTDATAEGGKPVVVRQNATDAKRCFIDFK